MKQLFWVSCKVTQMNKTESCPLQTPRLGARKESEKVSMLGFLGVLDSNSEKTRTPLTHGFLKLMPRGSPWKSDGFSFKDANSHKYF